MLSYRVTIESRESEKCRDGCRTPRRRFALEKEEGWNRCSKRGIRRTVPDHEKIRSSTTTMWAFSSRRRWGENGYRYYRPNDLFRFKTVRALTDAGFTLQEVRSVFSEYDPDTLGRSVAEHRAELRAHIDRLAHAASLLDEIDRQISSNREAELGAFFS